ncbi:MAG: alpha/beta hydrolase [Solirubrobacterales bacterium]
MADRSDISFAAGEGRCDGWLYRPGPAGESAPCVVMAHGFGACKEARLDAFAERFAAAGLAALVFDYRHFGTSTGRPRQLIDIRSQHADWEAAIGHARSLEGVDPARVALWGTSFSGGHVLWAAARDARIAAVVSQVPHTSGPATLRMLEPVRLARLTAAGLRDRAAALFGRSRRIAIVGPPGSGAAMTGDDAATLYPGMYPRGFRFDNSTPARILLPFGLYSPGREARHVRCPVLVIVADRDTITPPEPARAAARAAPRGELLSFDGAHFDIYRGERFEWAVEREREFLTRTLLG